MCYTCKVVVVVVLLIRSIFAVFYPALVVFTLSLVLLDFIFSLRKLSILRRASLSVLANSMYYHDCTTFQTNDMLLSYSPILVAFFAN